MRLSPLPFKIWALSEKGPFREDNQDRMRGKQVGLGMLYVVADGMGGHNSGAVAAELTADGLCHHIDSLAPDGRMDTVLRKAFEKTNEMVYKKAHGDNRSLQGMGSTAVALLISGRKAHIAHVGDSRAYLFRKGRLRRLTIDHTKAQKMLEAGILTAEQARDHPGASVLERAIGSKQSIDVEISKSLRMKEGDNFLLCTDGLSGYVHDTDIERILGSKLKPQEIPKKLCDLALQKGSKDNITVQFIQYGHKNMVQTRISKVLYTSACAILATLAIAGISYLIWHSLAVDKKTELQKALGQANRKYEMIRENALKNKDRLSQLENELEKTRKDKSVAEKSKEDAIRIIDAAGKKIEDLGTQIDRLEEQVTSDAQLEQEAKAKVDNIEKQLRELPSKTK